jgi:hypothetical protein
MLERAAETTGPGSRSTTMNRRRIAASLLHELAERLQSLGEVDPGDDRSGDSGLLVITRPDVAGAEHV